MITAGADKGNPFSPFPNGVEVGFGQTTTDRKISTVDFVAAKTFAHPPRSDGPIKLSAAIGLGRPLQTETKGRR